MLEIIFINLFNRFDYDIVLNSEGLTILTGPNGYGKSTILKSIQALSNEFGAITFFSELDFEKIIVKFKGNSKFVIKKTDKELWFNDIPFNLENFQSREKELKNTGVVIKFDADLWYDRRRKGYFTTDEYLRNLYVRDLRSADANKYDQENFRELLRNLRILQDRIGEVNFISEQRLIKRRKTHGNGPDFINTIENLPNQFLRLISDVQGKYSTVANGLDSTYPNRLFHMEEGITEREFNEKMKDVTEKVASLSKYGLSSIQEPVNIRFKEEHAKALKIYFEDFETKFNVYKDFITKLDLYTDIINQRLSFKSIKISKESGIYINDDNKKELDLSQLSSGEKQEIVLFYELIFDTNEAALLLIDEPEISLHIAWQKKFMDDLEKIISYKKFNAIVATHSPQIINNHWDNQIDLGELYGTQLNQS